MSRPDDIIVAPARRVSGEVRAAGDKSISHRAILLGAVARGETQVLGANAGEDVSASARAVARLGARVSRAPDGYRIEGRGGWLEEPRDVLDLGNSGTALRLLAGLLSPQPFLSVLTGDDSLRMRPMEPVVAPLRQMGSVILTRGGGHAPLVIAGSRLRPIAYEMAAASAQVKGALLFAALFTVGRTEVREPIPTRDHTERLLREFGVEVDSGPGRAALQGPRIPDGATVNVPGDISAAAFYLAAGVLAKAGEVVVRRVGVNPTRMGFISVLRRMGAAIELLSVDESGPEPMADLVARPSTLRGTRVEPEEIPGLVDEVPILAVAAAHAEGSTEIRGAAGLRSKESDRIRALAEGLRALGGDVDELADGLVVRGRDGGLGGGCVQSRGDHRIAMSFAVAGLSADGTVRVRGTRCIGTSDPGFLDGISILAPGSVTWEGKE